MTKFVKQLKFYFRYSWWKFVIIGIVLAIDLVTKIFLVNSETLGTENVLIKDVLIIYPVMNDGAGFSFFAGKTVFLIVITFVFLVLLATFDICFKKKSILFVISTGLIISGAIGNLIDRLAFGKVRDFIYLKFINFPVFNIADISLTAGVICLAVYLIFYAGKKDIKETMSQSIDNQNIEQNNEHIDLDVNDVNDINIQQNDVEVPLNDTNSQTKENDDAKDNS